MSILDPDGRCRICFVVYRLNIGGLERFVSRLVNNLDKDFYEFSIVSIAPGGDALEWIENRTSVKSLNLNAERGKGRQAQLVLNKFLESNKIDIVQSHNWGTLDHTHRSLPKNRPIRFVHAERGTVLGNPAAKGLQLILRALLMRFYVSSCDQHICNAHEIARKINRYTLYPLEKIKVIPNGIPNNLSPIETTSIREQQRLQFGFGPDDFVVGMVGRLVDVKNYELAIRSFASMQVAKDRPCRLLIVGDGPLRGELQQLAESKLKNKFHSVHFAGEITHCMCIYPALDLMMNTSRSEGMSQALLEALSFGCPVLATDVGDHKKVLMETDGVAGFIVKKDDQISLTAHLGKCYDAPGLLKPLGQNALQLQRMHYSLDSMLRQYDNLYRRLLNKSE
jgi:glycosyltransferase involved in cell wall biosynthesis